MSTLAQTKVRCASNNEDISAFAINGYTSNFGAPEVRHCFAKPPSEPFQSSKVEEHRQKRRKVTKEPKLDQAQLQEQQHHERIMPWLAPCIQAVQDFNPTWLDSDRDRVVFVDKNKIKETNLASWQRASNAQDIRGPLELSSSLSVDALLAVFRYNLIKDMVQQRA